MEPNVGAPPPDLIQRVKQIVVTTAELPVRPDEVADDADLFDECGFDSMSIVKLVLAVEQAFDISLEDGDVTEETFHSPRTLAGWIATKVRGTEAIGNQQLA